MNNINNVSSTKSLVLSKIIRRTDVKYASDYIVPTGEHIAGILQAKWCNLVQSDTKKCNTSLFF